MRVIALLALCVAAVSAASPDRIIGGTITTINNYPHAAPLLYSTNLVSFGQSCAGTIINQRSILSAAHCFQGVRNNIQRWRIRIGSSFAHSGGTLLNVAQIINHGNYNSPVLYNNDVAILRSASAINANGNTIAIAGIASPTYVLGDNQPVWAVGWGVTESGWASEQLRHVQVWVVSQAVCRQRYGTTRITDQMLCSGWINVGGRDQCQGDSGGPLYHNGVVVGVCSWGAGCADPYYPGVNARVSSLSTWIQANA